MFLFYRTPVYKATQTKQSSQISNEMRFRKNRQGNDSTCTSFVISSEFCAAGWFKECNNNCDVCKVSLKVNIYNILNTHDRLSAFSEWTNFQFNFGMK
jgi:hypothetical protein